MAITKREELNKTINLGSINVTGNNGKQLEYFWTEAHKIVQGCYDLLKPEGHAIWVCKDYVKAGKIVPFSDRWATLCESIGFKGVCWHQASLTEKVGSRINCFGEKEDIIKERKSFFRRLAEAKAQADEFWPICGAMRAQPKFLREAAEKLQADYESRLSDWFGGEAEETEEKPKPPTEGRTLRVAKDAAWESTGRPRMETGTRIDHEDVICTIKTPPARRKGINGSK